jgi:hypothetical protein
MHRSKLSALKRDLAQAYGRVESLEAHLTLGANILDGGPIPGTLRRNGILSAIRGHEFEVVAYEKPETIEPAPTYIGKFRARSAKEAVKLGRAQAKKEAPPGTYVKFVAGKIGG